MWLLILFDFLIQLAAVARAPIGVVFLDFGQLFKRRICVQVADFVDAVHGEFGFLTFRVVVHEKVIFCFIEPAYQHRSDGRGRALHRR